jgi:hypothetical protein
VFCISVCFLFLMFSISWVTSSLKFSIFIFNSCIYLFINFSVSLWCLFKAPTNSYLFVSVYFCVLYFWCL